MHEEIFVDKILFRENHSHPSTHQRIERLTACVSSQGKGNCIVIERDVDICPSHLSFGDFSTFASVVDVFIPIAHKFGLERNAKCQQK